MKLNAHIALGSYLTEENVLSTLKHSFSVIGLNETWFAENVQKSGIFELPSYNSVHAIRQGQKGGGVAIYIQHNLLFIQRNELSIKADEINVESIFIEIKTNNAKNIIVGCIYKPPDTNINQFNLNIRQPLRQLNIKDKTCYILGDFNINLFKYETHVPTSEFVNILHANYFFQ